MSNNIQDNDIFFRELISQYMDKLFYFCLKKTGDKYEAENLAADIVLNVLISHSRWPATTNFSAWFWQIARNRYSVWAKKRAERDTWIVELNIEEYEIEDEDAKSEALFLHKEDLSLLRRELAFISSTYRDIIVAYYIEDKSIKEIATDIGASEKAVNVNLFRARKALKEGMDMARTFGPRSYRPGEVKFFLSYKIPKSMYAYLNRLLTQNILLETYENPSTIEEIAIAIGTSVPYLEDEINILTKYELLEKTGKKYFTNFFIGSKESQYEIYNLQNRYVRELSADIDTIVSDLLPDIRSLGTICENHKSEDLKWLLLIYTIDIFLDNQESIESGTSQIFGFEKVDITERAMGYRRLYTDSAIFFKYFVTDYGFEKNELDMFAAQAQLLANIVEEKRTVSSLSKPEKSLWDRDINNVFAYENEDGTVIPKLFTFTEENRNKIVKMIKSHPLAEKVTSTLFYIYESSAKRFEKDCPKNLINGCKTYAISNMRRIHTMLINEEINSGKLKVPDDPATSTACCYLKIK